MRATRSAWRKANAKKVRAAYTAWARANPEKVSSRRLRRYGIESELTATQWQEILLAHKGRCAYCHIDGPMTKDHKIPLVRGGTDNAANIVPACRSCNCSKNNKTPEEFTAWRLSLVSKTG